MKVLFCAIITIGIVSIVTLFTIKDVETVKLAIASIGSMATGTGMGYVIGTKKAEKDKPT